MINNWNALATAISMPYNDGLIDYLEMEAAEGKEFVTVAFYPDSDYILNFSGVYSSDESKSHHTGHLSFETKDLLPFIEQMLGLMNGWLRISLLSDPLAMGEATKLSHDPKSKQFLNFCFCWGRIFGKPFITDFPKPNNHPGMKFESCSVIQFRAWRRGIFLYESRTSEKPAINTSHKNNKIFCSK